MAEKTLSEHSKLVSLASAALRQIVQLLEGPDVLILYMCGEKTLNSQLARNLVTELSPCYAKKSDGKLPTFVRDFECLAVLSISFGEYYSDLYRIDQFDLSLLPPSLTKLSLCCANSNDFFEEIESFIQSRESCLERGQPSQNLALKSMLPNIKQLLLSTRSASHSIAKRIPQKYLPDTNLVSVYSSFPLIGSTLTKLKTSHWEQAFIGLLPDSLEELELEVGLIIKSFTAFNIMPRSLTFLKGLIVMDHSIGWEVEFDPIFETLRRRRSSPRFLTLLQQLEATTEVYYKVRPSNFSFPTLRVLTQVHYLFQAIWDVLYDWMSNPARPHPLLTWLIDYPPNLKTLHMEFGDYGSLLLFHLPTSLQHLRANNTHSPLSPHHLRFLPSGLKSLHLDAEIGEVMPAESLLEKFPDTLTSLHLNSAFSISLTLLKKLPVILQDLDVYVDKEVGLDIFDSLPRGLKSLNLHRNFPTPSHLTSHAMPRLPPTLTRATLPGAWNSIGWSEGIPTGLTSLRTSMPLRSSVVSHWGRLTSLTISKSPSSSDFCPDGLILNLLPSSLTALSCPYAFLGVHHSQIEHLVWPSNLIELALLQAHRAPLEFFYTFPTSLRCLYIGDTQYHGEFVSKLPKRLAWLQLKTPIRSEYMLDLPPHLLAFVAYVLSPTSAAMASLPKSLRYIHTPNLQIDIAAHAPSLHTHISSSTPKPRSPSV